MPTPRPFDARSFFGYTGNILARPDGGNLPSAMRDRFARTGNEAFIPFINPWATIAEGDAYRRAAQDMEIRDAELGFLEGMEEGTATAPGLRGFIQQNPKAVFSPMVRAYQTAIAAPKDPFEAKVAAEGAGHLKNYRGQIQQGMQPMDAYAQFRDAVKKEEEAAAKTGTVKDEELWFVEEGGDVADYAALKQQGASRGKMLEAIRKKGKPITTTEGKKLAELQSDMEAAIGSLTFDNEDDYEEAIVEAYGRKPSTQQEWQDAYFKLKEKVVGPKQKAYNDYVEVLIEQNKRIPGASPTPAAPVAPAPNGVSPAPATSPFDGGAPALSTTPITQTSTGYDIRQPFAGEMDFFKKNPNVAGMAAEDGKVVLNPNSKLSQQELAAVAENEGARLFMRENSIVPDFDVTEEQKKSMAGTDYGKGENLTALKQTIAARILSGDPSAKNVTAQQRKWVDGLKSRMSKPRISPLSQVRKALKP